MKGIRKRRMMDRDLQLICLKNGRYLSDKVRHIYPLNTQGKLSGRYVNEYGNKIPLISMDEGKIWKEAQ